MAESDGEDRTEDPTDKRKRESREEGQLPRSRELGTVAVMLAGVGGLLMYGAFLGGKLLEVMRSNFSLRREEVMDERFMGTFLLASGKAAMIGMVPMIVLVVIAAIIGHIALGGFLFSGKVLAPKASRMNPLSGIARMFSKNSLVELLKALGKFIIILGVSVLVLMSERTALLQIAKLPLEQALLHSMQVVGDATLLLALGLLIIAAVDVPFQIFSNRKKLMMTKQEIKDEYKDAEGKPEVKGKIRQMQRQMAQRRMMAEVPNADVVITNPTHFAVALKYDASKGGAPVLVAKGSDFTALKIREIAQEHQVSLLESPGLARAVYYSTEVDQEIPAGLYVAVAQVLAYVYQLRQFRAGRGRKPKLADLPIPTDLRRDEQGKPTT